MFWDVPGVVWEVTKGPMHKVKSKSKLQKSKFKRRRNTSLPQSVGGQARLDSLVLVTNVFGIRNYSRGGESLFW
jgi:hypothetical protein